MSHETIGQQVEEQTDSLENQSEELDNTEQQIQKLNEEISISKENLSSSLDNLGIDQEDKAAFLEETQGEIDDVFNFYNEMLEKNPDNIDYAFETGLQQILNLSNMATSGNLDALFDTGAWFDGGYYDIENSEHRQEVVSRIFATTNDFSTTFNSELGGMENLIGKENIDSVRDWMRPNNENNGTEIADNSGDSKPKVAKVANNLYSFGNDYEDTIDYIRKM